MIKPEYMKILTNIFCSYCPNALIWAYGSRVNGDCHAGSDFDIVVRNFNDKNKSIAELRTLISESNIPFLVDISDFNDLSENFQAEIKKKYVIIFG
ncbi:MAG: nucleotidyltransferase domain-containing protein [Candidatus Gastranaerophilales bacterium]|nr:nucleotidyltransferase domain-containing protein [Candidatus Gastranaerophilales bacterium]